MIRSSLLLVVLALGSVRAEQPDVAADEAILRGARIATDGPGLLKFFERRVAKSPADLKRIDELIAKLASNKFRDRDAAAKELVNIGVPARAALQRLADSKELELRRRAEECLEIIARSNTPEVEIAAVRVLRARKPTGACATLLEVMPTVRDADVEEEILTSLLSLGVKDGKADEAMLKALTDNDPARRGAAAIVVGRAGNENQRVLVRQLLQKDSDNRVKLRAAQGLVAGKDAQDIAALLPLLTDAPVELAELARDLLIAVSLDKGPTRTLADNRKLCRDDWQTWLKDNEKKIDLKTLDVSRAWPSGSGQVFKVTSQFLDCLIKGDGRGASKLLDVPFCFVGEQIIEQKKELEELFAHVGTVKEPQITFGKPRLLDVRRYISKAKREKARAFYEKVPTAELRIVFIVATQKGSPKEEGGVLIVRVRNGQAKIIGIDEGRGIE